MAETQHDNREVTIERPARRPSRMSARRVLVALVFLPVVLVVGALLLLQIDGVSTPLVNRLAARLSPWTGSTLTVASASLDGVGRIVLRDVRLANDEGTAMATIDTAALHIRPLALLRRAVIISNARIVGADVTLRQRADSVWDLLEPFIDPDPGDPGEPREIHIDDAEIIRSRVEARYYGAADSVLRIESVNARVPLYRAGPELRVQLDTISAEIYPASRPGSPASLRGRFALERGILDADSVRLDSDSSSVLVDGTLLLPAGEERDITDIDFHLSAKPLDFRDIGALVPGFDVPGSLRLEARVTGTARSMVFEADGRSFDGATVHATGRISRNPGDSIRYVIDAEVRGVDPHLWSSRAPRSRIDADANVALAGTSPETIDGNALFRIARTEFRNVVILPSTVQARFDRGTAYYTVRGGVAPWAEIDGSGKVRPFDRRISGDFAGNVRQLRDTAFGTVTVSGVRGFVRAVWRNQTLDGRAEIAEGVLSGVPIDTAGATLHYARATAAVTATVTTEAGHATLDGYASDFDRAPAWKLNLLRVANLNLARIDTSMPRTRLNATAIGSGRGFTPATMTADADISVATSSFGGEVVDTAAFGAVLRSGNLDVRGGASTLRGDATFVASITPFAHDKSFRIAPLRFNNVAVDSGRRVILAGQLTAEGVIPRDTFPRVTGILQIDPTRINEGRLAGGRATFALAGDSARIKAHVSTGNGTIDADGVAQLVRDRESGMRVARGRATGTAHLPDLDDFIGGDSANAGLDAQFAVEADGTDPASMAWSADVTANGQYAGAVLDTLTLRARIASGVLRLDTLVLRSNVATGNGSGVLAITERATPPDSARLRIRIDADSVFEVDRLLPIQNFSLRGGNLVLDATNSAGGIDAKTSLTILGLISPGAWADSVRVDGTARLERLRPRAINATFAGNDLGYGSVEIESVSGKVDHDTAQTNFDLVVTGDAAHSIRAAGSALTSQRTLTFANMVVMIDTAAWTMPKPAVITYGPRTVVSDFVLERGTRKIELTGYVDRAASQDLRLTLDSVPIRGFAEFIGIEGADGLLDGTVRITGPAARVELNTDMDLQILGTRGKILLAHTPDSRVRVDVNLTDSLGKTLRMTGTVPLAISLVPGDSTPIEGNGPLALAVQSDSFSVGWLAPFARPYGISRANGALRTDINVVGTFADPAMSGLAELKAASVEYPRQGIAYRNINGEFTLGGDRVHVTSLRVVSEGTAELRGDIVMETAARPTLRLDATFDRFRAARNEWTRLGISGTAQLSGEILAPKVQGNVRLVDTDLYADPVGKTSGGSAIELTKEDFRMLQYYFGYDPSRVRQQATGLIEPWEMDLQITVGQDTWLRRRRSPELTIQLEGSLDLKKAPNDSIQLFGNINVLPARSYFEQFGRRFSVTSGSVAFNGPMMQWIADFNATYIVPSTQDPGAAEVVITLDVDGTLDDLHVTLGGDPAMETADILSYLATGRPAASAAEFGGAELVDVGTTVAASQLASVIEGAATKSVGLDVVEVRHNGIKGATIVAGRYVHPRLFVGFEQPLVLKSENDEERRRTVERSSEVQLEYRLYRWLLATLEGSQSNFSFLFKVRRAF